MNAMNRIIGIDVNKIDKRYELRKQQQRNENSS